MNTLPPPAPAPQPTDPPAGPAARPIPAVLARLLASRKFWIALVAVAQSIIFACWPAFPPDVWKAVDALAAVLIATIAYEDAAGGR